MGHRITSFRAGLHHDGDLCGPVGHAGIPQPEDHNVETHATHAQHRDRARNPGAIHGERLGHSQRPPQHPAIRTAALRYHAPPLARLRRIHHGRVHSVYAFPGRPVECGCASGGTERVAVDSG